MMTKERLRYPIANRNIIIAEIIKLVKKGMKDEDIKVSIIRNYQVSLNTARNWLTEAKIKAG